ncbi:hypothetical protein Ssi03_31700 [Sphaerisporangium siamense]|nr:hypothetical protein Ssi03_31700 [Sphaerisporangium siamense]
MTVPANPAAVTRPSDALGGLVRGGLVVDGPADVTDMGLPHRKVGVNVPIDRSSGQSNDRSIGATAMNRQ